MNFDELYEKYTNGTATDEEKRYVEEEIAKARKLSEILDSADAKRVIEPADKETVKKARKRVGRRAVMMVTVISAAVILVLSILASAVVYASASHYASRGVEYTKSDAGEIAKRAVINYVSSVTGEIMVTDIDRELEIRSDLKKSFYVYEVSVRHNGVEYEIEVDPRSGTARIADIDD